jgi:hypothetical protein
VLRELEQIQRPFDVHLVSGNGCEFGPRGEQCRQVEDELDLEFRENALQQPFIENRAGEITPDESRKLGVEWSDVDGDDGSVS